MIHQVEQLAANVRGVCEILEVDLSDVQAQRAVFALTTMVLAAECSPTTRVLVEAWREAVRVR